MRENLDLRKRILKMREVNNLGIKNIESNNSNHPDTDLILIKKENISLSNLNDIKNENITNKKSIVSNHQSNNDTNYEPHFRLLANKFNEAVEVILELSDKVKNLEKAVYLKEKKNINIGAQSTISNVKIIVFIMLIFLFAIGIIYLPINVSMLKLFLREILSLI